MPRKRATAEEKGRGPCSLEAVKQYLMSDLIPDGYGAKNDRRVLQRRAKSFVLIGDDLYFTGGRSKHKGGSETGEENIADEHCDVDCPQMLRKVLFSEEEKREVIGRAHVGEDGSHFGMEKTTEQVSNQYYWLGITYIVRDTILNCPKCSTRTKNPSRLRSGEISQDAGNTSHPACHTSEAITDTSTTPNTEAVDLWGGEAEDENADEAEENHAAKEWDGQTKLQSVKQETDWGVVDDPTATSEVCNRPGQKTRKLRTRMKKKPTRQARRPSADRRKWGACSSLDIVRQYLMSNIVPDGYNKNDRRVLLRRAKSFILIKDELYFTGGRTRQKKGLNSGESETENSETETEQAPILRKVVFSEEERQEILLRAHIADDGSHQGMERTKEQVSNEYYWMGITYGVRALLLNCPKCSSRSKQPDRSPVCKAVNRTATTSKLVRAEAGKSSAAKKPKVADRREENVNEGARDGEETGDEGLNHVSLMSSHSVKEEQSAEDFAHDGESHSTPTTGNKKENKEHRKALPSEERERGACCTLELVKQHLLTNRVPEGYNRNDRRALLRRSKSFVMIKDDMYFTGGRSRQSKTADDGEEEGAEDPEDEPDHTQVLRKVVFSWEEKQEVLNRAHIGEDGVHYGVEKTTERVSNFYYWLGITYGVRKTISNCPSCSCRSRNICRTLPISTSTGLSDTAPTLSSSHVGAVPVNTAATRNSEMAGSSDEHLDDEPGDDGDNDDDGVGMSGKDDKQNEDDGTGMQAVKQESLVQPMDVFYLPREVCSHFWQKVEIQLFGPFQAGKKLIYVAVALDSYSQFPEAMTIEVLSSATLTNFLLNLFCRYGVMEKVLLLQNEVTRNKDLFVNMQDLLQAGISPSLQCPLVNPLDERWSHIEKSLVRFIGLYPDFWFHCLEAFMVPLRIALPPEAVYSPYYLVHGREAPVPDKVSQLYNVNLSGYREVQLTEDQEKQTVDMITTAYGIYSDNPSIQVSLPDPLGVTVPTRSDVGADPEKPKKEGQESEAADLSSTGELWTCRRSRHAEKEEAGKVLRKEEIADDGPSDMEIEEAIDLGSEDATDPENDDDRDATYRPNLKTVVDKSSPVIGKRKRGRPRKVILSDAGDGVQDSVKTNIERKKMLVGLQSSLIKNMKQLPLDTFYFIVKQYLEHSVFPPGTSTETKQSLSRLCQMFTVKDGKLYSNVGKSTGRLIISEEKMRISLLRKAHARAEVHHGRKSVLKFLSDLNVFWNGMSLDLDAFIHSCPECICHNPLGNLPVVHIPSKSAMLTAGGRMEDEPHLSEDEEEESSYEDLIQFLTDGTFPTSTTCHQQRCIQERSESFRIIQGSLYYQTQRMTEPLQVLFSENLKRSAIQEAHVENGQHLSQQDTQAKLRRHYFWSGMTFDVMKHVMACCMKESLSTTPVLHRNPVIQERVHKIRSYYTEGKIPKLDARAITAVEVEKGEDDTSSMTENQTSTVAMAAKSLMWDHAITKTVRNIIEAMEKQLNGEKKKPKTREGGEGDVSEQSSAVSARSQKANKCQFCGVCIGGIVAYKMHVYKHTGVKPFICSTCGKTFTTNRSLLIHNRKHTGIKPYLCNQCGRGFFRSASLHYHLKAHAVGRGTPESCDICHRSFSTHHRLMRHKEFKHPAQAKVYICNQCGKHFTAARSLKRHEQIHTGHRKYQCQYCSKSFFRKEYLNAHLTNHVECERETQKLKPHDKLVRKPQTSSPALYWAQSEQMTHRLESSPVADVEAFQTSTVTSQATLASSSITAAHMSHLPPNSVLAHCHQMVHHSMPHPSVPTARLMNVAGSHGPLPLTVSSARASAEVLHTSSGQEILLHHDAAPVQYSVDCLPGEGTNLSDADLTAFHLLTQTSISGPNLNNM